MGQSLKHACCSRSSHTLLLTCARRMILCMPQRLPRHSTEAQAQAGAATGAACARTACARTAALWFRDAAVMWRTNRRQAAIVGAAALVLDVHHAGALVPPAVQARLDARVVERGALGAVGLLAARVAHIHLRRARRSVCRAHRLQLPVSRTSNGCLVMSHGCEARNTKSRHASGTCVHNSKAPSWQAPGRAVTCDLQPRISSTGP